MILDLHSDGPFEMNTQTCQMSSTLGQRHTNSNAAVYGPDCLHDKKENEFLHKKEKKNKQKNIAV